MVEKGRVYLRGEMQKSIAAARVKMCSTFSCLQQTSTKPWDKVKTICTHVPFLANHAIVEGLTDASRALIRSPAVPRDASSQASNSAVAAAVSNFPSS